MMTEIMPLYENLSFLIRYSFVAGGFCNAEPLSAGLVLSEVMPLSLVTQIARKTLVVVSLLNRVWFPPFPHVSPRREVGQ